MQTIAQTLAHRFFLSVYLLTIPGDSPCMPSVGDPLYWGLVRKATNSLFQWQLYPDLLALSHLNNTTYAEESPGHFLQEASFVHASQYGYLFFVLWSLLFVPLSALKLAVCLSLPSPACQCL